MRWLNVWLQRVIKGPFVYRQLCKSPRTEWAQLI